MIFLVAASPLVPTGPLRETRGNMRKQELVNLIVLIISMGAAENSYELRTVDRNGFDSAAALQRAQFSAVLKRIKADP